MDFLSGVMLWGAAAAAIPVILHLTGRAKPVVHKFPALRFLVKSQRSSSRALRIKHLLLLVLRVAALALLALALARPLWPFAAPDPATLNGTVRGDFVLVLDASMSMQFKEQDLTRFENARRQALRFLDRLAPEARAALILATEDAEKLQGRLTLHHELVRESLEHARPTGRGLDLARALNAARAILERDAAGAPRRAVLFFTDLQENAYQTVRARGAAFDTGASGTLPPLQVVNLGGSDPANGGILAARIPGPTVAAEQPVTLNGRIRPVDRNRPFHVDLYIDGVKVDQQAVDAKGAEAVDVTFTFPAGKPGPHAGALKLAQQDGLLLDQERTLAYQAGRPPRVLVIEPRAPEDAPRNHKGPAFFLRATLQSPAAVAATGLAVSFAPPETLDAGLLAQHQVAVLADVNGLGESQWSALRRFVDDGGGLFVWLGSAADPARVRRYGYSEFQPHHGLLPGRIEAAQKAPDGKPLAIKIAQEGHPLLARFTPGVRSALQEVPVLAWLEVKPELKDAASTVLLSLANGAPLLLEKTFGRGRVLACAVAPDLADSSLPKTGEVFVTLVLEACRLLAGRGEEAEVRLGCPLVLTISDPPADGAVSWKQPGDLPAVTLQLEGPLAGEKPREPAADAPEEAGKPGTLVVPALNTTGLHTLTWKTGKNGPRKTLLLAANPEPSESDLVRIAPQETARLLAPWPVTFAADVDDLPTVAGEAKPGRELPVHLLLLVFALLIVESFLSNRLYPAASESAEPPEPAPSSSAATSV